MKFLRNSTLFLWFVKKKNQYKTLCDTVFILLFLLFVGIFSLERNNFFFCFFFSIVYLDNRIGDEGAKALAFALKLNKQLIYLDVTCRKFEYILTRYCSVLYIFIIEKWWEFCFFSIYAAFLSFLFFPFLNLHFFVLFTHGEKILKFHLHVLWMYFFSPFFYSPYLKVTISLHMGIECSTKVCNKIIPYVGQRVSTYSRNSAKNNFESFIVVRNKSFFLIIIYKWNLFNLPSLLFFIS